MLRSTLIPVAGLSLVALIAACATAPEDDLGSLQAETKQAEPEPPSSKLPPPSTTQSADAGTDSGKSSTSSSSSSGSTSSSSSSGSTSSSSGSTSSSSGSTSSSSSSGSTSSSSSGGTGATCDLSDAIKTAYYFAQVSGQSSPVPCPCAAGKCCYLGVTCVNQ